MGCCESIPPHQSVIDEIREVHHFELQNNYTDNLETINNIENNNNKIHLYTT